jgi:hypothetical protein
MSDYAIRALDASTWDAFARLAEKHKGMGFGGCWCTWFHSRVGGPEGEKGRPWKERLVRKRANCAARATFLNRAQGGSQKHPNGRLLAPWPPPSTGTFAHERPRPQRMTGNPQLSPVRPDD